MPNIKKLSVALDAEIKNVVRRVTLDSEWRAQPSRLAFAAVVRHASNGPHTNLRKIDADPRTIDQFVHF